MRTKKESFPLNVLHAIGLEGEEFPDTVVADLFWLVYSGQSQRSADIFFAYYKELVTFQSLSEKYGVSRERCGQIVRRVLMYLKRPGSINKLKTGVAEYYRTIIASAKAEAHDAQVETAHTKTELKQLQESLRRRLIDVINESLQCDEPHEATTLYAVQIETLDLSTRTFNCLWRRGLYTVGDVIAYGPEKLIKLRNFGVKSYAEIESTLTSMFGENPLKWPEAGKAAM